MKEESSMLADFKITEPLTPWLFRVGTSFPFLGL
jgi:hypothetical protein